MSPRIWISGVLMFSCLAVFSDEAEAQFRRRRTYYYNNYNYYPSLYVGVAPKVDEKSADNRYVSAYYSYDKAMGKDAEFADRLRVYVMIDDEEVLNNPDPIVAEVKLTDLSNSSVTHTRRFPVTITEQAEGEYKLGVIDVINDKNESIIGPAKIYRLFVNLHTKPQVPAPAQKSTKKTIIGSIPTPYYVATSGKTRLDRARRHIAMRAFKEWYYTERGWASEEYYVMDCHAYYLWAIGSCTKGASYGQGNLGYLFDSYNSGGEIAEITKKSPIHGDYVRMPGHTFMLLCYDEEQGQVWTMEGNYGATIEVAVRTVDPGWTVGHLKSDDIQSNLFKEAPNDIANSSDTGDGMADRS